VVLSLSDWRRGLLAVILIGVLQDVLRKLTPGVPTYFILWSMTLYLFIAGLAFLNRMLPPFRTLYMHDEKARNAWNFFLLLIVLQLLNAFVRWGSPATIIFGAIFYLGPVLSILVGFAFAKHPARIRQYLVFYLIILIPTCLTVYLSPDFQDGWPVLRDVGSFIGSGLKIYDVGAILESYSGILRVGEVSAWHAATACMFLIVLVMTHRSTSNWLVSIVLAALLIGVIILTGRRKMLMTLSIFIFAQWALLARYQKGVGKLSVLIILFGTLSSFSFTLLEPSSEESLYLQRSSTVYGESTERFGLALDLMRSAFNQSSGIGLGAGAADVGGRYAGVRQSSGITGAAESGLGKVMIELGLLGILSLAWLLIVIARSLLRNLRVLIKLDKNLFFYQVSFLSFLFANAVTFCVATQVYGDYFILTIIGTVAGFAVRINSVASRNSAFKKPSARLPTARILPLIHAGNKGS